jgi:hypothetical protein
MTHRSLPVAVLLLAALLLPVPTLAASKLTLDLSASLVRNDNFLEYSQNQIDTYEAGTHPLRYAVSSIDDVILGPGASLTWELDEGKGRRHALRAHWDGDFHSSNPGADFRNYSARWTESFRGGRRFAVGFGRLDNFYVRQLRADGIPLPPPAPGPQNDVLWRRAEFDQDAITASWREPLRRHVDLGVNLRHEIRTYVAPFDERSSKANEAGLSLGFDGFKADGSLDFELGYRRSVAKAHDSKNPADTTDVSYHGFEGGVSGRRTLSHSGHTRWIGDAALSFATRDYDSQLPERVDAYHVGRSDMLIAFEVGVRAEVRDLGVRGFVRLENNDAKLSALATATNPSTDSGSYRKMQVGVEATWSLDLLRAKR